MDTYMGTGNARAHTPTRHWCAVGGAGRYGARYYDLDAAQGAQARG